MALKPLPRILRGVRKRILSDEHGDLPLWWRLRLWQAMNERFPDDGALRRSCLALHLCYEVLPAWDRAQMPVEYAALPRTMVEIARGYLLGVLSNRTVEAANADYIAMNQDIICAGDWEQRGDAVFVYQGSHFVVFRVLDQDDELYDRHNLYQDCWADDEAVRPTEIYLGDDIFWDVHFVASMLASNGAHWEPERCDNELRRKFWLGWLDETLPQFLGDSKVAKAAALLV